MTTTSERQFNVFYSHKFNDESNITAFYVSDMSDQEFEKEKKLKTENGNEVTRPRVATFPVSQLYDANSQKIRAHMLCDYLNKIQEATNKAIRNTNMIDALSINPNP